MTSFVAETYNNVGSVPAQPASGAIHAQVVREGAFFRVDLILDAARVVVTDAAASGSHGTLPLFTFIEGAFVLLGSRQAYDTFAEGGDLTGANDAVFDIGVGTVAKSAAADGALGGANDDDVGPEIAVTLVDGVAQATTDLVSAISVALDGSTSAKGLHLNFSGTAATIDATSYMDVSGTISVAGMFLSDD